ncbi:MAG: histone deacetylase [Acidobacteriota bacterium]
MPKRLPKVARRALRRARRRLVPSNLRIVYHPRYGARFPGSPVDPLRAERILTFLLSEGLILRDQVKRPKPIWLKTLERVHAADYLESLHEPETVSAAFGLTIERTLAERVIDLQRLHAAGTLLAVRRARRTGVGINLGGGFHHAHADRAGGFCMINDLAAAIAAERARGFSAPILVVDLDLHDGDGTRSMFRDDSTVHTLSIHAHHWDEAEAIESTAVELGARVDGARYLEVLRETLPPVVERFEPKLVIYAAGCDPARDDALGDWQLDAAAMLERDRFVVEQTRAASASLAVVLAGGYGPESWRYSARFLSDLERPGRPIEPPSTPEITLARYRWISSLFDPSELTGEDASGDEFGFTEEDLELPGWRRLRETRFLGFYSSHGVELVLERAGFLDRLRDLGYPHPQIELQLEDPGGQTLRVYGDPDRVDLLVELRLHRDRREAPGLELLSIDWLLLQNPRAKFPSQRGRLPGQTHPGLGMLSDVVAMLIVVCERLHLDGMVFVPSRFHIAATGRRFMRFFDPQAQIRFEAMADVLEGVPLDEASRRVADGRVIDQDSGEPVAWSPLPMGLAVSDKMNRWLDERSSEPMEKPRFALRPPPVVDPP